MGYAGEQMATQNQLNEIQSRARKKLDREANCKDKPARYFDETDYDSIIAEAALSICSECKVQEECLLVVNPSNSFFDGIAGGIIFKNGQIQEKVKKVR